jgi:hypothetical protein
MLVFCPAVLYLTTADVPVGYSTRGAGMSILHGYSWEFTSKPLELFVYCLRTHGSIVKVVALTWIPLNYGSPTAIFSAKHRRRRVDRSEWNIGHPEVPSGLCSSAAINIVRRRL